MLDVLEDPASGLPPASHGLSGALGAEEEEEDEEEEEEYKKDTHRAD